MSEFLDILRRFDRESDLDKFLRKYKIAKTDFQDSGITWEILKSIKKNYLAFKPKLEPTAQDIVSRLFKAKKVHSIRFRLKDEEHLLDKVIRKRIENKDRIINDSNFIDEIDDLIGVRVLHLYKDDWRLVHQYILETYELNEPPIAYIREGDETDLYTNNGCEIKVHPRKYRSVHYIIKVQPTKETFKAEIQVRTLFEEAWSEIDHEIRYPNNTENLVLGEYLNIFNRIAGSADEMGMFIKKLRQSFHEQNWRHMEEMLEKEQKIKALQNEIEKLSIDDTNKDKLKTGYADIPILDPLYTFSNPLFSTGSISNLPYMKISDFLAPDFKSLIENQAKEADSDQNASEYKEKMSDEEE